MTSSLAANTPRRTRSESTRTEWAVSLGVITLASIAEGSSRRWLHAAVNLLSAAAVVMLAVRAGVRPEEQGLSKESTGRGLRLGAAASVPVAAAMVSGARTGSFRDLYQPVPGSQVALKSVLVESLVRVPFVTALPEEMIFRGGLFALATRRLNVYKAATVSSLLFGLFHIMPTMRRIREGRMLWQQRRIPTWARLLLNVIATTLAGLVLTGLRRQSNSVVAPWLLHSTANASGILAGWFASRRAMGSAKPHVGGGKRRPLTASKVSGV